MIEAKKVTKKISTPDGQLHILNDINLHVAACESLAIVGASGSGKSTLLSILAGLDLPTSGEVLVDKQNIVAMNEEGRADMRARYVGFVFQSFQLLPGLTAVENVALPLELHRRPNAQKRALAHLERVGLGHRTRHYPKQLSGGEQQRVAIARAFASEPRLLFADEPTGNLDSVTGSKIINLLFDLNRDQGTTLILVTHEQRLAQRCLHTLTLEAGRVIETTTDHNTCVDNADHTGTCA